MTAKCEFCDFHAALEAEAALSDADRAYDRMVRILSGQPADATVVTPELAEVSS